jgi:hypothetical protein
MTHLVRTFIGLGIIFGAFTAQAESFYVPGSCDTKQGALLFENKTDVPQAFWVQLQTHPIQELRYDLDAKSKLRVSASEMMDSTQGFAVKTYELSSDFNLSWSCAGKSFQLSSFTSPDLEYPLSEGGGDLQLLNLSPLQNDLHYQILDAQNSVMAEKTLHFEKSYETQRLQLQLPAQAKRLKLSATGRIHSLLFDAHGIRTTGLVRAPTSLAAPADKVYFLISTRDANPRESYVVGMDDPKMIATAREQIQNPKLEKILMAGITLGTQNINRSFSSRDRSPYSWSVSRLDGFADFALIDCDGSPDIIEEHLMERLQAGGNICFWHYRVIRELTSEQVQRGY